MDKKKVLIGMSGGVDSSVAAAILKEQGYYVAGATMRLWTASDENAGTGSCSSEKAIEDARHVCDKLGIDFYVLDFKDLFKEKVVDYFVNEYINGYTPNPCIVCNKHLKFDAMLNAALSMGFDYVATGHYAKIEQNEAGKYILRASTSDKKDQSYVLYQFTQEQLSHTLMPLGEYSKEEIRKKAEEIGLDVASKPDSMEICFVEDGNYAEFIKDYANYSPLPGNIFDVDGNILGKHKGLIYYTVGQRKGIGAYGRPMFVMKINAKTNSITLGEKGMEYSNALFAKNVNFISGETPPQPIEAEVKIRYQAKSVKATITPSEDGAIITFNLPVRAVTPGQSVVFYDGDIVLGGGIVEKSL